MRSFLLTLTIISIFVVSAICGYYIYETASEKKINEEDIAELARVAVQNGVNINSPSLITSSIEEKVSPNATLIIKKHYQVCGHTTKDYAEIPAEIVNLTEQQTKEAFSDWELKGFSANEIVILKEVTGICNEHYILKEKDGLIAVYTQDETGQETLDYLTEISTEYLTAQDQIELQNGIQAIGREQLNSALEDYE